MPRVFASPLSTRAALHGNVTVVFDALIGFLVVAVAVAIGWSIAKINLLGKNADYVLSRIVFFVLSPALLFTVLARADVAMLFSHLLLVSTIIAFIVIIVMWLISRFVFRRTVALATISSIAGGQVNSNNIGIPLSLYLLGSAAYPAPVILMQLILLTPIVMFILDASLGEKRSVVRQIVMTFTNPIVLGSVLGTVVSAMRIELPPIVMDPIDLVAGAAVPIILINYGMSLAGRPVLAPSPYRKDIVLASALKLIAMPALAWVFSDLVFDLSAHETLVIVVLAALPTAQNVFNYAQRYDTGVGVARDVVAITTVGCVPVLLLIKALLGS